MVGLYGQMGVPRCSGSDGGTSGLKRDLRKGESPSECSSLEADGTTSASVLQYFQSDLEVVLTVPTKPSQRNLCYSLFLGRL